MNKKKMTKVTALLLAFGMLFAATACGSGSEGGSASFAKGSVAGTTYTNTSVGIKAEIPAGFTLADDATIAAMEEAAKSTATNLSESQVENALSAINYEFVATADDGSAIQVIAEDMKQTIGKAVSVDTYLKSAESQVETAYGAMGLTTEVTDLGKVQIAGKDFNGISIAISGGLQGIKQDYYIYKIGDYMYCIIITATDSMADALDGFVSSMEAVQ